MLDIDSASIEARSALGRLLLAEQRNPDALKEYGQLLDVLESQRVRVPRGEPD